MRANQIFPIMLTLVAGAGHAACQKPPEPKNMAGFESYSNAMEEWHRCDHSERFDAFQRSERGRTSQGFLARKKAFDEESEANYSAKEAVVRNVYNKLNDDSRTTEMSNGSNNCAVIPRQCQAANDRGIKFLQDIQGDRVRGIVDAASKTYCMALVGIELNKLCAAEYANEGRHQCAASLDAQIEQYRRTLRSAEESASAASINNARNSCNFE